MSDDSTDELRARFETEQARADAGGGLARQRRQERLGRGTARGRIAALVDESSFLELERHVEHRRGGALVPPGDGLVAGIGRVGGRPVAVYAHDPTVFRGALGHAASRKLCRLMDRAGAEGWPIVALADCDGVRVDEGTDAVDAYGEVIDRRIRLRGEVPQLTLVCGLCVGAAAYDAALTDVVGMVEGQSFMFITGAKLTEVVTGQRVSIEELGGPEMHATKTGACHAVLPDEAAGFEWLRRLLGALESGEGRAPASTDVEGAIPREPRRGYDSRTVIDAVVDEGSLLELSPTFARNLVTGLARLDGRPVALLASQPQHRAGCLDIDASRKGAHFVRFASARGLPLLTLIDVPGYWPGKEQEQGGILPFGAELLDAYGRATVPRIAVVLRKSYGGANVLSYAADLRFALPTAAVAPMGIDAAERLLLPPIGDDASPKEKAEAEAQRAAFREHWAHEHGDAWAAARTGYFDQVVAPERLREVLVQSCALLAEGSA